MRSHFPFLSLAPNFVGSMEYEDFVFLYFRETSEEYTNCGKVRKREKVNCHLLNIFWEQRVLFSFFLSWEIYIDLKKLANQASIRFTLCSNDYIYDETSYDNYWLFRWIAEKNYTSQKTI
jgi:hypothetical protein